jgi:hypothetical protein
LALTEGLDALIVMIDEQRGRDHRKAAVMASRLSVQERGGGEKVGGCRGAGKRIGQEGGEPCAVFGGGVGDGDKAADNSRVGGAVSGVLLVSHLGFRPRYRSPLERYHRTYGWRSIGVHHCAYVPPRLRACPTNPTNSGPPSLYVE